MESCISSPHREEYLGQYMTEDTKSFDKHLDILSYAMEHGEVIVKPIAEQYSSERMVFVLANTIQQESWDGRFSSFLYHTKCKG